MSMVTEPYSALQDAEKIFSRVLVGIDGSPEALDAAQQAALLKASGGTLSLVAAWNLEPPLVAPMTMLPPYDAEGRAARSAAEDALHVAKEQLPTARTTVVHGFPAHALIDEIKREQVTLVAVGSHGRGRAAGILVGSTATSLVHNAPCSVLVTRTSSSQSPRRIVVGVDGSNQSALAYAAARHLADRIGCELVVVVADGGKSVDPAGISADRRRRFPGDPRRASAGARRRVGRCRSARARAAEACTASSRSVRSPSGWLTVPGARR